jgi:hypothetical protein
MLITIYKPDGTKERKAVGYAGGACHQATAPYEAREVPGAVKTPTDEACLAPAVLEEVAQVQG